jgi:hypothetical protein
MEQTESVIIRVAPDVEEHKIAYVELHFVRTRYGREAGLLWCWDQCPAVSAR